MKHVKNIASSARRPAVGGASEAFYDLERMGRRELETALLRGHRPDPGSLSGWEFRGANTPAWARAAGIKKFIKGFERRGSDVRGYNVPVTQNRLRGPWLPKPSADAPRRFGFYRVIPVDPASRDNAYLHALLLDYGAGDNPRTDPSAGLRDYLVQVDARNPDLFLGKAYYALGPARVATSFFVLERHRRVSGTA